MKVEILRDKKGEPIGYTIKGETPEEILKAGIIRDMYFWRMGEHYPKYSGRSGGDDSKNDPGTLHWIAENKSKEYWDNKD